jgi:hypothetical protein
MRATVDDAGTVDASGTIVRWRVRPADVWLEPGADVAARSSRPDPAPIAHTAVRVPRGDAIERVYAVEEAVVVEVQNASPGAIAVSFLVDATAGATASFSNKPAAREADGAMVFPVPHRTAVRCALAPTAVDARALPGADVVARGWDRILDRGMRVEVPAPLQHDVDAARADLLLAAPSAAAFATLEAWGFDAEAIAMWEQLGLRARRAARRPPATGVLMETHAALVREANRSVECVPGFRAAWLGQSLAVHDAPLQSGRCSFAVRWHGARPALLWDVPAGMTVRAPALDPAFAATDAQGETLLAEPPASLLPMGERTPVGGASIEPPAEFT